ncbi:MAG: rod shape-determining protein MreD [Faecalibacterium sp.]
MESRRKRNRTQFLKWGCYALLLLLCTVLQTTPGLLQFGQAKPLFLLPLCLAVAVKEGEFAGALFGAVCGLMWDYTAGRTVGMLALELLILCFVISVAVQLYLKSAPANFALLCGAAALLILSCDFMFFYWMPGYSGAAWRYMTFVLPCAALTVPVSLPLFWAVRRIHQEFWIDNGVV